MQRRLDKAWLSEANLWVKRGKSVSQALWTHRKPDAWNLRPMKPSRHCDRSLLISNAQVADSCGLLIT